MRRAKRRRTAHAYEAFAVGHGGDEAGADTLSSRGPRREDRELGFAGSSLSTGVTFSPGIPCDDEFGHLRGEIFSVCAAYERTVAAERAPRPLGGHRLRAVAARTRAAREGDVEATVHLVARRSCSLRRSTSRPAFRILGGRAARSSGPAGSGCPPVPQALCPMLIDSGVPPERAAWLLRLHWAAAQAAAAAPPPGGDGAAGGPPAGDFAEEMLQGWSLALGGAVLDAWGIPATPLRSRADALRDRDPDAYAALTAQHLSVVIHSLPRAAGGGPSPAAAATRVPSPRVPRTAGDTRSTEPTRDASRPAGGDETTPLGAARAGASLLLHFASGGLLTPHVSLAAAVELVARCVRSPAQAVHPRRRRGPAFGARLWHMLPAARISDAVAMAALAARVLAAAADSVRESLLPSYGIARHLARAVHDAAAGLSAAHSRATRARAAAATQTSLLAAWRDLGGALHAAVCACPALAQDPEAATPPLLACAAAAAHPVAHPLSDSARAAAGGRGAVASAQASRLADTACGRDLVSPSPQLPWPQRAPGCGGEGPGSAAERAAAALSRALAVAAARCREGAGEEAGHAEEEVARLLACTWLTPVVAAPLVRWRAAHAPLLALCPASQAACATTLHRFLSLALSAPLARRGEVMAGGAAMVALHPCRGPLQLHAAADAAATHAGHAARALARRHAHTAATKALEAEIAASLTLVLCNSTAQGGAKARRAALLPALRPARSVSAVVRAVMDAVSGANSGSSSSGASPRFEPLLSATARLGRAVEGGRGSAYPLGACADMLPAAPLALPAWAVAAARRCFGADGPQTDASTSVLMCATLGVLLVSGVTPLAPQGVRRALNALQSKAFARLASAGSGAGAVGTADAGAWSAPPLRNVALALTWLTAELGPDPPSEWADTVTNSVPPPVSEAGHGSALALPRLRRRPRADEGSGNGGENADGGWLSGCSTDDDDDGEEEEGGGGEAGAQGDHQSDSPRGVSPAAVAWCAGLARVADQTKPAPAPRSRAQGAEAAATALCDTMVASADATPTTLPAASACVRAMNLFASAAGRMSLGEAGKVLDSLCTENEAQSAFVAVRALCVATARRQCPPASALLACAALGAMTVGCCAAGRGARWRSVLVAATSPPASLRGGKSSQPPLPPWVLALTSPAPARHPRRGEAGRGGMFPFLTRRPTLRGGMAVGGRTLAPLAHAAFAASVAVASGRYGQRHSPDPDAAALLRPLRRRAVRVAACAGVHCVPATAGGTDEPRDCLAAVLRALPQPARAASSALQAAALAVESGEEDEAPSGQGSPLPARDSPLIRVLRRAVAAGAREARHVLGLPALLRLPPGAAEGDATLTEQEVLEGGQHSIPTEVAPFQSGAPGEAGPHSVGTPVVGTPGSGFGVHSPSWHEPEGGGGGDGAGAQASAYGGVAHAAAAAHGESAASADAGVGSGNGSAFRGEGQGDGGGAESAGSLPHTTHSPPAPQSHVASPASLPRSPGAVGGVDGLPPSPLVASLGRPAGVSGPPVGSSALSVSTASAAGVAGVAAAAAATAPALTEPYTDTSSTAAAGVGTGAQATGGAGQAAIPVSSNEWTAAARQWEGMCSDSKSSAVPRRALVLSLLSQALAPSHRRALPAAAATLVDLASHLAHKAPPAEGAAAVAALLARADAAAAAPLGLRGRDVRVPASAALHLWVATACAAAIPAAAASSGTEPGIAAVLALASWLDATAAVVPGSGSKPHVAAGPWLGAAGGGAAVSGPPVPALEGEVPQEEEEEEEAAGHHHAASAAAALDGTLWVAANATPPHVALNGVTASAQFPPAGAAWGGGAARQEEEEEGGSFLASLTPRSARQLRTTVLSTAHQLLQWCWRQRRPQASQQQPGSRGTGGRAAQAPTSPVAQDALHGAAFLLCRACAVLCGPGHRVGLAPLLAALGGACPLVQPRDRGPVWAALPQGASALVEPAASAWATLNSSWEPLPTGAGASVRVPGPAVDAELGADAFAPVADGSGDGGGADRGNGSEGLAVRVVPAAEMVAAALTMVPPEGDCCTAMATPESRAQIGRAVETGAGGELVGDDDDEDWDEGREPGRAAKEELSAGTEPVQGTPARKRARRV